MINSGLPTSDDLLAPVPVADFLKQYWQRKPFVIERGNPCQYGNLFDRGQLHQVFTHTVVGRRDARVVKNGAIDPERTIFDGNGRANPLAMMAAYADGFTIVINNLQSRHRKISYLCRSLEMLFHQPLGANAYLTPPGCQGLTPHYDDHDVFVLQIEGEKTWRLYGEGTDLPLRGHHVRIDRSQLTTPIRTHNLAPGDLLYLPRGIVHDAGATEPRNWSTRNANTLLSNFSA